MIQSGHIQAFAKANTAVASQSCPHPPPTLTSLWALKANQRQRIAPAAIKAEFAFQLPTLHVGGLTLCCSSSSNIGEWAEKPPSLFSVLLPSLGTSQRKHRAKNQHTCFFSWFCFVFFNLHDNFMPEWK